VNYLKIANHYEKCLEKHGDSNLGVDWPNAADAEKRYRVILQILNYFQNSENNTILDLGCGTGHLLDFIRKNDLPVNYTGYDISQKFIDVCLSKYPLHPFKTVDLLEENINQLDVFDFVLMNGLFTEKQSLTYDEMFDFFSKMITKAFQISRKGIAFNLMSKCVDWERKDLFHVPLDHLQSFLTENLSRNFIIRNDYGLYEFMVYLFKESNTERV